MRRRKTSTSSSGSPRARTFGGGPQRTKSQLAASLEKPRRACAVGVRRPLRWRRHGEAGRLALLRQELRPPPDDRLGAGAREAVEPERAGVAKRPRLAPGSGPHHEARHIARGQLEVLGLHVPGGGER